MTPSSSSSSSWLSTSAVCTSSSSPVAACLTVASPSFMARCSSTSPVEAARGTVERVLRRTNIAARASPVSDVPDIDRTSKGAALAGMEPSFPPAEDTRGSGGATSCTGVGVNTLSKSSAESSSSVSLSKNRSNWLNRNFSAGVGSFNLRFDSDHG